jgi:hypothetical protein
MLTAHWEQVSPSFGAFLFLFFRSLNAVTRVVVYVVLGSHFCGNLTRAEIQDFFLIETHPQAPVQAPIQKLGSSLELLLNLRASQGLYTLRAFANSDLSQVVAEDRNFSHLGGMDTRLLRVPLVEGENEFFLRLVETQAGIEATTSSAGFILERDLEFSVSSAKLDHLEDEDGGVGLYTRKPTIRIFYTLTGNSSRFEVVLFRNGLELQSFQKTGTGSFSESGIALETQTLNLFQIKVKSMDINAVGLGFQAESNLLRVFHDDLAPVLLAGGISTTFQPLPPPLGAAFGPTALASFGLIVEGDTPFARITVLNERTGTEVVRRAENDGRAVLAGIELSRDPSGGALDFTTTTYTVRLQDEAGNIALSQIDVERLTLEPCFNLLVMEPGDFGVVSASRAVHLRGSVCDGAKPHRVVFSLSSEFSENSFFKEEQFQGLGAGALFEKDISLPSTSDFFALNPSVSIQAIVLVTSPVDPRVEESSPVHDLGVVILDLIPPAPPGILTETILFATNSSSLTVDGSIEREGRVELVSPAAFTILPSRSIQAQGGEFRAVLKLDTVQDGEYLIELNARDRAGNSGLNSSSQIILKRDTHPPQVKSLRVNSSPIDPSSPVFLRSGQSVLIQVLMDEFMQSPPRCFGTQQGAFAVEAGLSRVISAGFEYEFQFTVQRSFDGQLDGPVEIFVSGGRDAAGHPLSPSFRESQAFMVDTLAPVLSRSSVLPADGSLVNSAPAPLRLVMQEHPLSKGAGSGPNPFASSIKALGPIELTPNRSIRGRTEVFDPRTLDFYPDPQDMNEDGTYLFQVEMVDHAGNRFLESVVLQLDQEKPSSTLVVETFPTPAAFFNAQNLPLREGFAFLSASIVSSLTAELNLGQTEAQVLNFLRKPQEFRLSQAQVVNQTQVEFIYKEKLATSGEDDGVFSAEIRLKDLAGNLSDSHSFQFVYDTLAPQVLDGQTFPVPEGFQMEDLRFPQASQVVKGPLRLISAVVFDGRSPSGFLGSGVKTSLSTGSLGSTSISLSLVESFGSSPSLPPLSGQLKFRGDLSSGAPVYGGPSVSRVLLELNLNPLSLEPAGIPTGGLFDGLYQMQVAPVDMSLNFGAVATSFFLYDTLAPTLSVDLESESWITSGVIRFSGSCMDGPSMPLVFEGFGSTLGTGVRMLEVKVESINNLGSATFPPLLDWTTIPVQVNLEERLREANLDFDFEARFHQFSGPARLTVRAIDLAGNQAQVVKNIGLETELLSAPVLLEPTPDQVVAGGILSFRWQPVQRASSYILELTDPENRKHQFRLSAETLSMSLNLDILPSGRSFWTVIAEDGAGHQSFRDQSRKFLLDRDFPRVLSSNLLKPIISSDLRGRILERDLRFEVNFSEPMNSEHPPKVIFYPASSRWVNSLGQVIIVSNAPRTVEMLSYLEDKYLGMVRLNLLEDNSDINGIGKITVEDYRDSAGHVGAVFQSEFEVDLGPWFELKIFSNPVREQEVIFVVKGLHHLGGAMEEIGEIPLMEIRQLRNPGQEGDEDRHTVVELHRLGASFFQGAYPLDLAFSGSLRIEITGSDTQGNRITRTVPFQVQRVGFSKSRFFFPYETRKEALSGVVPLFNVFPRVALSKSLVLTADLNDYALTTNGSYGVMRRHRDGLEYISQDHGQGRISFKSKSFSDLYLIEDSQKPQFQILESPDQLLELEDDLSFQVIDLGVGVNPDSVSALVNGRKLDLHRTGSEWTVRRSLLLSSKQNRLQLQAVDHLGNKAVLSLIVVPVGPIQIQESVVVPNPVQDFSQVILRTSRTARRASLHLLDSAGATLGNFATDLDSRRSEIPMDSLITDVLANGVYFLKLRVEDSEGHWDRRTLKFVLLR